MTERFVGDCRSLMGVYETLSKNRTVASVRLGISTVHDCPPTRALLLIQNIVPF